MYVFLCFHESGEKYNSTTKIAIFSLRHETAQNKEEDSYVPCKVMPQESSTRWLCLHKEFSQENQNYGKKGSPVNHLAGILQDFTRQPTGWPQGKKFHCARGFTSIRMPACEW